MSETRDLAADLVQASPAEREQLLRAADRAALEWAIGRLGHLRQPAAAEVLGLVDLVVDDRSLKKAARRELHRLRSMGIHVPQPSPVAVTEATPGKSEPSLEVSDARATDIDAGGLRAVWLIAERRLGGVWFAAALLNELRGLQELSLVDTTRKRYLRELEDNLASAGTWVSLPGDYALRLVREAVDASREQGVALPTRYGAMRDVFGEAQGPPERALIYETISPVEVNFNSGWLDDSPLLLAEPEVADWYVAMPADLRSLALEVAAGAGQTLVVPGRAPEQQMLRLLADAAEQALTAPVLRALRRRFEETAYIFLESDRLSAARLAVAAALGMDEGIQGVPPESHPLLRLLLTAGLARLIGPEIVGGRPAAEVLLDLADRTFKHEAQSDGPVETRASGLIVPR